MYQSLRYSNLSLRIGLAIVFLWFGIDKFLYPDYWVNAWLPSSMASWFGSFGISASEIIYTAAIFEVLVAVSLLINIFTAVFSVLAVAYLLAIMAVNGFSEVLVRDVGLAGAFLALVFWPDRRF
jgi:uncharacterized membrane protein YphA (DoxX/SURF4 family)